MLEVEEDNKMAENVIDFEPVGMVASNGTVKITYPVVRYSCLFDGFHHIVQTSPCLPIKLYSSIKSPSKQSDGH